MCVSKSTANILKSQRSCLQTFDHHDNEKKKKTNEYKQILKALQELQDIYPSYGLGRHLCTALEDYGDLWGVSDKEILFAITKYRATLEMDVPRETEDIEAIVKDGMNLSSIDQEGEYDNQQYY